MKQKFIFISLASIFFSLSCFAQDFTYPVANKFEIGKAISPITPSNSSTFDTYAIKPDLTHDLQLNPTTGIISGIPKELLLNTYTITAKNKKTGVSGVPFNLSIEVFLPRPATQNSPGTDSSEMWTIILCFVLIAFLIAIALMSKKNKKEALGLPVGSVRAIIAILFVIFFALLSVVFYFNSGNDAKYNSDLAKQIITILGTLVTAVSSFYFGSKASEQAHTNAAAAALKNPAGQQGQQFKVALSPDPSVSPAVGGDVLNTATVQIVKTGTTTVIKGAHLAADPNGTFTFTGVAAGNYTLSGSLLITPAGVTPSVTLTGTQPVSVQAGMAPITLTIK